MWGAGDSRHCVATEVVVVGIDVVDVLVDVGVTIDVEVAIPAVDDGTTAGDDTQPVRRRTTVTARPTPRVDITNRRRRVTPGSLPVVVGHLYRGP